MPAEASGPVLIVKSPILIGLASAIAGSGRLAARTEPAAPLSNVRRVSRLVISPPPCLSADRSLRPAVFSYCARP